MKTDNITDAMYRRLMVCLQTYVDSLTEMSDARRLYEEHRLVSVRVFGNRVDASGFCNRISNFALEIYKFDIISNGQRVQIDITVAYKEPE